MKRGITANKDLDEKDPNADLGFGSIVISESQQRFLNRDGSFNVHREGLPLRERLSVYHELLSISWTTFLSLFVFMYLVVNALFAGGYVACGEGALVGGHSTSLAGRLVEAFFFSVHTFGTIGYGNVAPASLSANLLVTVESIVGLLSLALATGLIFARFARPSAKIIFSDQAIIGSYHDRTGFMFRIANRRDSQIIDMHAKVFLSRWKQSGAARTREFLQLDLEREQIAFFPLTWTVVHPIDENSPLYGVDATELTRSDAEFLILLTGFDETFSMEVKARSSYKATETVFGARFRSVYNPIQPGQVISVNIEQIHAWDLEDPLPSPRGRGAEG